MRDGLLPVFALRRLVTGHGAEPELPPVSTRKHFSAISESHLLFIACIHFADECVLVVLFARSGPTTPTGSQHWNGMGRGIDEERSGE